MSVLSELSPTEAVIADIKKAAYIAASEILSVAHPAPGSLFVVGCSTSEVGGAMIGTSASPALALGLFQGIYEATKEAEVYLCAQCCEHLNRALIVEAEAAKRYGYDIVNVVPIPEAGGSFATAAYQNFHHPVALEHIRADVGMDIGDTFIGMHLRDVAVPFRISTQCIGNAHLTCARTRPKFIGGSRAYYDTSLIN
jgi:uncharacterized protein (TIGR01440 family)